MKKPVFIPASIIILGLIAFAAVYGATGGGELFSTLNSAVTAGVGWWYILAATGFVVFAVLCGVTRIGAIRLGRDDEQPEFGLLSWFAMLFSAGMGIGLVFYGVAEPLSHYVTPPEAGGVAGSTDAAANQALELTMFHWGLHAWAIYVVVGLGLAYMTYRRGRPLSVRWLLEPLLGRRRVEGWIGHTVDTVAIVGTLFGVATSLGFGVQQILAGLGYLGWLDYSTLAVVVLIAIITGVAIFSVLSGVDKGLKWLSNTNMGLAAALAVFVLLLGPTLFLTQSWVENLGGYLQALPEMALRTAPFSDDGWAGDWTIFYWGWWMSWAPFVGMFIARISRGRTIREFIAGVLITPTVIGSLWFTIFGDAAILRQRDGASLLVDGEVNNDTSLFQFLEGLPLGTITSVLAIAVIVFFFVTSSDSGSLVIEILSTGGDTETPKATRVYWATLEGVAAAVLLLVGGSASLTALQTVSIATAVPFSIVLVLACVSLYRAFRYEVAVMPRYLRVSTTRGEEEQVHDGEGGAAAAGQSGPGTAGTDAPAPGRRREVSATFAGLSRSRPGSRGPASDVVVAVHEVPHHQVRSDGSGRLTADEVTTDDDPLAGEHFDTPEFADSAEGQQRS
ncbi:BCCT family transporter [Rhodococcus aerolatus]